MCVVVVVMRWRRRTKSPRDRIRKGYGWAGDERGLQRWVDTHGGTERGVSARGIKGEGVCFPGRRPPLSRARVVSQQLQHHPSAALPRRDGGPLLFTMSLMDFVVSRELGCCRARDTCFETLLLLVRRRASLHPPPTTTTTTRRVSFSHDTCTSHRIASLTTSSVRTYVTESGGKIYSYVDFF